MALIPLRGLFKDVKPTTSEAERNKILEKAAVTINKIQAKIQAKLKGNKMV